MNIIKRIQLLFKKHKSIVVLLLLLLYHLYLFSYPENFKLAFLVSIFVSILVYLATNNFFFSLFSVYSISLPLKVPAKQYPFLYASPLEYQYEALPDGLFDDTYVTISTIWGAFLVFFYINRFLHHVLLKKTRDTVAFASLFAKHIVSLSLLSWILYFSLSFIGSSLHSFNPFFSINYLLHESNTIIVFISMLYLFLVETNGAYYFCLTLLANIAFHGLIGVSQIFHLFSEQNYLHNRLTIDPEQKVLFRRIGGLLGPNQNAYFMAISSFMLLPFARYMKKVVIFLIYSVAAINIIFSQSRSVWLSIFIILLLFYVFKKRQLQSAFSLVLSRGYFHFVLAFILLMLIIVIPRISVSSLFFSEEGGGSLRKQMFAENIELLHQSPWFGFGAGTNVRALLDNFQNSYVKVFPYPVHFTYLQIAVESGIPAAIAFFIPYYLFIRQLVVLKRKKKWSDSVLISIISCIIVTLVYFCFQPIVGQNEFYYSGIILGLGAAALIKANHS